MKLRDVDEESDHFEEPLSFSQNDVFERVIGRAARMLGTDVQHQGYNDTDHMFKDLIANNFLAGVEFGDEPSVGQCTSCEEWEALVRHPHQMCCSGASRTHCSTTIRYCSGGSHCSWSSL
ncbi:uncharacterized protein LOC118457916 [Anopheles albimanus]|uniref:uncharacterized protein LOC118457916 n=1 Tax=Anopheles albimanus TaxID=7167 RepID=UPI0016407BFF|nr:uncharacterized protein LOC118457916 [Anopheles albimanus]